MSENNKDSFDKLLPDADVQNQEEQAESEDNSSEKEEKSNVLDKCQLWANWHIFIIPARMRERESENHSQKEDDNSEDDNDRFVPKTKDGRQIGIMQFILNEKGRVSINSMLSIDMILRRIHVFSPQMAGVDRYDDWGVLQWHQGLRRVVEDFFTLTPQKRKALLNKFDEAYRFSPEIFRSIWRLENLIDIPRNKNKQSNSDQEKPDRCWPKGLAGRDLELFKLLSGIDSMSPRNQALSVLNYILQDDSESTSSQKREASNSSKPIRLASGDKERISHLIKRFPMLKNRYPYLLMMFENEVDPAMFNACGGNVEHIYSNTLPNTFHLPLIMYVPQKQKGFRELMFAGIAKSIKLLVVLFLFLLLSGILLAIVFPD